MTNRFWRLAGIMLVALMGAGAWAAPTPTVVWEAGEFEKTKNGYSIVLNGNSIDAGGRIAIDSSAGSNLGAYIDVSSAGSKKATVLIKYSNLQPLATSNRSLTSMYLEWSPQSADVGARTKSANTLPITGFTSGNSNTYDFTEEESVPSFVAGTGHIILAIDSDTGTSCYTGSTLDSMVGGTNTGLKYGSYTIRRIAVGGANTATKAYSWDGVKIEKVAIFIGETYTNDDLADYEWPNAQTPVLGDGITAYYDCETHTDSGTTVTVTGKSWDGSTLTDPGNLSLQWNCNDGADIGTPSTSKFGLCYSGGGTGGRCWESSTCDGLLPGTSAGDWSFSFWMCGNIGNQFVNTPGEGDNQGFRITKDGSNHIVVAVSETTDGTSFNTVSITSASAYTFDSSHWHNIIVVRSGNTLTLYVDGTEAGTATMAAGSYLVNASNTLTMADSSSGGIGQGNGSDEYCVWNRALSFKEVLAIAAGTSTIGAMAETIPTLVSLEETGGYVKTATQFAFKNTTLDEITASTLKGRFGGESAGDEKGTEATFCCFATSSEGVKTCEAQISSGAYIKAVLLAFEQVGDDVTVTARGACYKTGGTLGQSVEADKTADLVLSTSPTVAGYGLYNLRLPRTPETSATVVWETGEFEMAKVGPDGYEYSFSSFGGLSVNDDGNLVVGTANAQGAIVNMPDTSKTAVSVLIKYSNLAAESGGNATLANCAINSGNTTYYLGARTITKGTLPLTAYHAGNAYAFNDATYGHGNVPSMDTGSGYFLFAHGSSNGTYAYSGETIGALDGGYNTQLKWDGYNITQVSIGGGFENNRAYCWKGNGTVIERVAIFLGSIKTPGDLADYYFPSAAAKGYGKWGYAKAMLTRSGSGELAGGTYKLFDIHSDVNTGTEYDGNTTDYSLFGHTGSGVKFWKYLCYASIDDPVGWQAPGLALRFSASETDANKTIGGTFGPAQFAGLYVESGATGYSFTQNGSKRDTIFGDPSGGSAETWFVFDEPFEVQRNGTMWFAGTVNVTLAEPTDVLTLNTDASDGQNDCAPHIVASITQNGNGVQVISDYTTAGGTLKMHGAGHLAATKLVASGATLDFSDIGSRYNDETPFINCPLVIDGDTKFVFPADITLPYTYKVATSITVNGDNPTYEYTDASGSVFTFEPVIDTENGTVTIPALSEAKSASLNLGTTRGTFAFLPELAELTISATELLSEDGVFSLVIGEGLDANVIDLILTNQNGEEVTTDVTYSGDTLTAAYAPTVKGKACWIDYEMEYESGNASKTGFENTGADTTALSADYVTGDDAFYNGMLYVYAHPYRSISYPTDGNWTAVVRCTVPAYENAAVITFGTRTGGLIGLVAGADPETEMKLVKTTGNSAFTVLSTMTVQNATTAQHVYVFEVENNTTIKVYCDGAPVLTETYDAFTLGGGIQVGSVHGGTGNTGIVRFAKGESPANTLPETVQKEARIDCVRLYQGVLGPNAIAQLSKEFPAVKLFEATISGGNDNQWATLGWTGGDITTLNSSSKIILTVTDDATLTLPSEIVAEEFVINITAGKTLEMVGGNTELTTTNPIEVNDGAVKLTGTLAANAEITGKLAIEGLTLTGSGALTVAGTITATEAVALQEEASIVVKSGATVNVTSGEFTAVATTFTLGPKTMATDNEDGTYSFEVAKAQIGETRYNTVAAAIAAFTDHDTVLEVLDDTYDPVSLEEQGIFWNESTRTYSYAAATIGTAYFPTLEAALSAASLGEDKSVTLFKNDTGATIAIPAGVALKLGGYTIAATPTTVDGYVIGITEGDTVYTSITNDATEWVGGASGNWDLYSNWSTGAVPGTNTVVTISDDACTIGISDYGSGAHACAAMIANGTVTFTYSGESDHYPEIALYGGISGSGKIIIRRAGLRNMSGDTITIACALGVEYNHTTNDSFLRGDNFEITGTILVNGYLKVEDGTTVAATGAVTLGNGSRIYVNNNGSMTIAELSAAEGASSTVGAASSGTLTVAKLTGIGNVTVNNGTVALLDGFTGTLGGTLNIATVHVSAVDTEHPVVLLASGCTIANLAATLVTIGDDPEPSLYRLYVGEGGNLYMKLSQDLFRSAATGGWMDTSSWTNINGAAATWNNDLLIYATIDAEAIDSIDIGENENVKTAELTITGGTDSRLELAIDGTIDVGQKLDLSGMAGTIVKSGAGDLIAKGDNAGATLNWTIEAGTLSLGGVFDSIGGDGTVVTMNGGVLDIAGAHGGSTVKKLVINGDGAVFTNSVVVDATYVYYQTFPFPQIEVNANGIVCSESDDLEWGAKAAGGAPSWITIAEGKTFTKTGSGKFYINNMAITGDGTMKVLEGVLDKGGTCTVDNIEIEKWGNVAGGGSITVNKRLTINNEVDATVKLAERSLILGANAMVELKNAGTLDVGTWRGSNVLKVPEAGGKLQLTLTGYDELEIALNVVGLDDAANIILKDPSGNLAAGTHTLTRSGDTIRIAREVDCMTVNPVTGEHVAVKYAFTGATDATWEVAGNWNEAASDYSIWDELADTTVPALPNSNKWSPMLFDGNLIQDNHIDVTLTDALEGWTLRMSAANDAHVNVATLNKLQGGCWIMADATSSVSFGVWGDGNNGGLLKYYVAGQNGVTFNMAFDRNNDVEYYFAGEGSVNYAAGVTAGTHTLYQADITLGDSTKNLQIIEKPLVTFAEVDNTVDFALADNFSLTVTDAADHPGVEPVYQHAQLSGFEKLGTWTIVQDATQVTLQYIGYGNGALPVLNTLAGSGAKAWNVAANWSKGVPATDSIAAIVPSGNLTVSLAEAVSLSKLLIVNTNESTIAVDLVGETLTATTIQVQGNVLVALTNATQLAGAVAGNGTVVYTGVLPSGMTFTNNEWEGTLWLERQTGLTDLPFTTFGNANSTLKMTAMQFYCHGGDFAGTLELSNADSNDDPVDYAIEISNGYSNEPVTFGKLIGSGTLKDTANAATQIFAFNDVSDFTGSIKIVGSKRIKIGAGSQAPVSGQIVVQPGVTATIAGDATWSAAGGIKVYGTLNVEGKISGSVQRQEGGKFVVTSGSAVLGDLRDFADVTLDAGAGVDTVSVEQTKLEAISGLTRVENIVDDAIVYINFIKYNGDEVKVAKDDDNVAELEQDPQVSGDVCWYDFTFSQTWYKAQDPTVTEVANMAGSGTGALKLDGNYTIETAFNSTNGNLRIRSTPYFSSGVITYPTEFSVAMYTMMPERAGDILMAFGTVAGGYLAVVRGDGPNEIQVVWGQNAVKQEIASFSVVAATQTRHLIMFTKSGQDIAVYLDGDPTPIAQETLSSGRTIANQFQVASIHGGEETASTGLQRPATDEKAELAMLRLYDYLLDGRMIARLAGDFEAEPWANFAMRALDAESGTNTWYDAVGTPWTYVTDGNAAISALVENGIMPLADAHVTVSNVSGQAQWLDVVLNSATFNADSGVGDLTVAGTSPVIIHHSIGGHAVDVAGVLSNEVDLTVYYGAVNMANTRLYMTDEAMLTLELTEFLRSLEAPGTYTLTGICGNFGSRVKCTAESDNLFYSIDGGIKYDSARQRYYVKVVAKRSAAEQVYLAVDGGNLTVGADTSVYYYDGDSQPQYTRLIAGDTLHLAGTSGTVILNKDPGLVGYDIPAGVTLVANNFQVKGAITGQGTLRCVGNHPKVDESPATTVNSLKNESGWTGTVEIENCNLGGTRLDNFGNSSSTLRLIGCSVSLGGGRTEEIGIDLADTVDGRAYDYGLWFRGVSGDGNAVVVYPKLTGTGTLLCDSTAAIVNYLRIEDMAGFEGAINHSVSATGGVKLLIGGTGDSVPEGLGDSTMYVDEGAVWQVYGNVNAATNLTVKGTLLATGIAPTVAADEIVFAGGQVLLGATAAYPMLQGKVTGAIQVDLADGLAGDSITALAHLGAEAAAAELEVEPVGNAANYTLHRVVAEQEDGTLTIYYVLMRNFFYIRVR